jgi:2-oxo-4-hydroxy-4-carboxy--5-ureidoimidazoline (OHCU) decarboxylase
MLIRLSITTPFHCPMVYNVFHVAGVKLFEMKNDTISVEKASGDLLSAFLGSFSPIGFFPLPTITQPFWELAKNENYFGSPIYKENFPTGVQSPASQLAMSTTRTPFKNAAKILNSLTGGNEYESGYMDVSPDALEHIAEFALGGAGTFGLRSMNAFEKWMAGEELESREVPFLRRVMGEPDKNIAVADYYDRKVKLEQKEAAIQGLRGADRIKYREQNQDYVTMFGVLNSIERKLRKVRQMESQLRSRAALSPANAEQYATGLEVLEERKQKLYDQFNNLYDKRVGRTK